MTKQRLLFLMFVLVIIGMPIGSKSVQAQGNQCTATLNSATSAFFTPSADSGVVTLLQPGNSYPVVERTSDYTWLRIQAYGGQALWIPFGTRNLALDGDCGSVPVPGSSPTPTAVPAPISCSLFPRLAVDGQGLVTLEPALNLRAQLSESSTLLALIPAGSVVDVLDGPVCNEGFYWWQVSFDGQVGWAAEGNTIRYFMEVHSACLLAPRLAVGGQGLVTLEPSLNLRTQLSESSTLLALVPAGSVVDVLDGPVCNEGFYWWQVSFDSQVGWAAEGNTIRYFMEAYSTTTCSIPSGWIAYYVKSGDTLFSIARTWQTSVKQLASVNCLENVNLIYVGQRLYVPANP